MTEAQPKPVPILLTQLAGVRCVIIGGGAVAARKAGPLLDGGAQLTVISPALDPQLAAWRDAGRLIHNARPYTPGDLQGAVLVIAATDRREVNAAVAAEARERGVLLNMVDDPYAGNWTTMSRVQRADLTLAIATGGESPALAALIRRTLEQVIGPEYGELAQRLGELRRTLGPQLPAAARPLLWRRLATEHALHLIRQGDEAGWQRLIVTARAELDHTPDTDLRRSDDAAPANETVA